MQGPSQSPIQKPDVAKGPKGDKGDPGEKGPKGDKGDPGEDGKDAIITEELVKGIIEEVINQMPPLTVQLQDELDDGTRVVHEEYQVRPGGVIVIPPQVLRVRESGGGSFRMTAPLGEPLKLLIKNLNVTGT